MKDLTFEAFAELSHELIAVHEPDGTILKVSPSCLTLTGFSREELIGTISSQYFHPDDREKIIRESYSVSLNGDTPQSIQYRFVKKDGSFVWFDTSTKVQLDEAGKVAQLITSSRDITSLIEAQKETQDSRKRYEMLAHNIPGVLYLCNNDETFSMIYLSEKVETVTGFKKEDFFTGELNFVKLYHPDDIDKIFRLVGEALEQKTAFNLVYRIKHKSGEWRWIEEHGQGIYDGDDLRFLEGVLLDITELKTTQQELKKLVSNLENEVEDRTKLIQTKNRELISNNNKLIKAIKKQEETQYHLIQSEKLASLGALIAGVGHEINNPLNFIQNGALALKDELVREKNYNPRIELLMDAINEGVYRTSGIVKSLSQFSRNVEDWNERCDIHETLDNCFRLLHNKLKHRIEVKRDYCKEDCTIKGNGGSLHQAFLNFISNAEQAIDEQGVLEVSTKINKGTVEVIIKDSGHGIPEEIITKIADPFFTTKDPGSGTGLGLSITYQIIAEHHGTISVNSSVGVGTEFLLSFPVA